MGKTAYAGPVYGAKSALWNPFVLVVSSGGATQTVAMTRVPTYEEWYVTEVLAQCSTSSTGAAAASSVANVQFKANGSTLHTPLIFQNTNTVAMVTVTPTPGEYEGRLIAAGSTITFVAAGGDTAVAMGSLRGELRGYIRFISSTRSEGG
jgi:hypothetical protein